MLGTFSPPLTSKENASQRSRHASQHVRDACAVMYVEIAHPRGVGGGGGSETFPAFPAHAYPLILRVWEEAHGGANTAHVEAMK